VALDEEFGEIGGLFSDLKSAPYGWIVSDALPKEHFQGFRPVSSLPGRQRFPLNYPRFRTG